MIIRTFIAIGLSILMFSCSHNEETESFRKSNTLNAVIGNQAFANYSVTDINLLSENEKISTHLQFVLEQLDMNNEKYDGEILEKRKHLIGLLNQYINDASFPVNTKYEGRRPCFIDEYGNYCAVGYLIKETAGVQLASNVNELYQYDYIYDMNLPEINQWVESSGLTLKEVAMIQPTYDFYENLKYAAVSSGLEIRNGDLPFSNLGLFMYTYQPNSGTRGNGWWRTYGLYSSFYGKDGWAIGPQVKRTFYSISGLPVYFESGLSTRFVQYSDEFGLQARPEIGLAVRLPRERRFAVHAVASYAYDIPIINQSHFDLNRHLFLIQLQAALRR